MKKNFRDLLCLGFIGVFYHFAIYRSVLIPMHIPVKAWQMLMISFAAILALFLSDTRPGRIVFLSAIGLGAGYTAYVLLAEGSVGVGKIFQPIGTLGKALVQISTGYYSKTIPEALLWWTVVLYALVLAIPVYYLLVPRLRFYFLIVPGAGLFIALWSMFRHVDKISFYIFITVAIVCFIHYKYILYRKKDSDRKQVPLGTNTIVFFVPVALLILLVASVFTVKNVPLKWPWLDEKINIWYWTLHEKYNVDRYDQFTLANTGFGDPKRLGGPVYPDYTPVMVVKSPTRVYLRGAVYDEYTGSGWIRTEQEELEDTTDRAMDLLELQYGWKAGGASLNLFNLRQYREYLEQSSSDEYKETTFSTKDGGEQTIYVQEGSAIYSFEQAAGDVVQDSLVTVFPSEVNDEVKQARILDAAKANPTEYIDFIRSSLRPQLLSKLHPEQSISVRYLQVRTRTLFTPLKTYVPINGLPGVRLTESPEGIFEGDVRLARDSEYYYNYVQPAYGMEALKQYYNSSSPGLYRNFRLANDAFLEGMEEYGVANAELTRSEMNDFLKVYRELEKYRDDIYNRYTGLPETIPERVLTLAADLTESELSTYSKVLAMEKYLRENFAYTLTPGVPPQNQDFVDYFMFTGKEGYCAYFASALCILTRAAGIPARYVEGFVMPQTPDKNGYYHVTNQYAHAWVEVYLEGVGWITFEPTPPYAGAMNFFVSLQDNDGTGYYPELPPEIPDQYLYMPSNLPMDYDIDVNNKAGIEAVTVILWAGAVIAGILFLNLIAVLLHFLVLRLLPAQKSVPAVYRYLVLLLRQVGCVSKLGETPKNFAKRVDERFQLIHMTMAEMVEMFYNVRFGMHTPDKVSLKRLFAFTREVKAKSGRALYLHKRILFRGLLFRG